MWGKRNLRFERLTCQQSLGHWQRQFPGPEQVVNLPPCSPTTLCPARSILGVERYRSVQRPVTTTEVRVYHGLRQSQCITARPSFQMTDSFCERAVCQAATIAQIVKCSRAPWATARASRARSSGRAARPGLFYRKPGTDGTATMVK